MNTSLHIRHFLITTNLINIKCVAPEKNKLFGEQNNPDITGDNGKPLEEDGLTCIDLSCQTAQAISEYQSSIGVWPAEGVWGPDTMEKMPPEDKELLESFGSWWDGLF